MNVNISNRYAFVAIVLLLVLQQSARALVEFGAHAWRRHERVKFGERWTFEIAITFSRPDTVTQAAPSLRVIENSAAS